MADEFDRIDFIRELGPEFIGMFRDAPNFQFVVNGIPPDRHRLHHQLRDPLRELGRQRELVFSVTWLWGVLPLPVVNYALLWRRNRPQNIRMALTQFLTTVTLLMMKLGRVIAYMILTGNWIRDLLRFLMMFGSMVTFSENFFQDIFTYAMRNYPLLVQRNIEMKRENLGVIEWINLYQFVFDNMAWNIRTKCTSPPQKYPEALCSLHVESLIFRFSNALLQVMPLLNSLPTPVLTTATIAIYLTYGLVGQFVGFNVVAFLMLHSVHRWFPYFSFVSRFFKALWHSTGSIVY